MSDTANKPVDPQAAPPSAPPDVAAQIDSLLAKMDETTDKATQVAAEAVNLENAQLSDSLGKAVASATKPPSPQSVPLTTSQLETLLDQTLVDAQEYAAEREAAKPKRPDRPQAAPMDAAATSAQNAANINLASMIDQALEDDLASGQTADSTSAQPPELSSDAAELTAVIDDAIDQARNAAAPLEAAATNHPEAAGKSTITAKGPESAESLSELADTASESLLENASPEGRIAPDSQTTVLPTNNDDLAALIDQTLADAATTPEPAAAAPPTKPAAPAGPANNDDLAALIEQTIADAAATPEPTAAAP
ncbi:MAG: hypothetical protein NTV94_11530, partial [Planctomycetota bacterium]|nr:hypothetical protein [Planctomycetota bacterium]